MIEKLRHRPQEMQVQVLVRIRGDRPRCRGACHGTDRLDANVDLHVDKMWPLLLAPVRPALCPRRKNARVTRPFT